MSELSLLSEVNRTSRLRPPTSDFDPQLTSNEINVRGGKMARERASQSEL